MLNKTMHITRLFQNTKAKHTSNAKTKQERERERKGEKEKVIESPGAFFLPHLGRTFPLREPLIRR